MPGMSISIGKVRGPVYNATEITVNNNGDGTRRTRVSNDGQRSEPITIPFAQQAYREGFNETPVGSSLSPPASDAARTMETDLPTPVPVSDDDPPDGGTEHDERDSNQPQANNPCGPVTAVQPSDDYRHVGRQENTQSDARTPHQSDDDPDDTTLLKCRAVGHNRVTDPLLSTDGPDQTPVNSPTHSSSSFADPNDHFNPHASRAGLLSSEPDLPSDPDAADFFHSVQREQQSRQEGFDRNGAGRLQREDGLTAPEGENWRESECPTERFSASSECSLSQGHGSLTIPEEDSRRAEEIAVEGLGEIITSTSQRHDSFRAAEGQNSDSVITDYGSISSRHSCAPDRGSLRRSGSLSLDAEESALSEETPHLQTSVQSAPSSLHIDGGGNTPTQTTGATASGTPQTDPRVIYVVHHKNMLCHDQECDVYVVDSETHEDVLQRASESGCFPDESSQLLQLNWREHFSFDLSCWKLTLKSDDADPDRLGDLTKHLCGILQAWDFECIRQVTKQLHQAHKAFFQSMLWQKGLVLYLGHTNPEERAKLLESPLKEECQSTLLQLLPDFALDLLAWEEPVAYEEEDGGQSVSPDVSTVTEVASQTSLGCRQSESISHTESAVTETSSRTSVGSEQSVLLESVSHTESGGAKTSPQTSLGSSSTGGSFQSQRPVSAEGERPPQGSSIISSNSDSSILGQICHQFAAGIERWVTQVYPKELMEQFEQKLAVQADSHKEEMNKMSRTVTELQSQLLQVQASKQQENKKLKQEMEERMARLEKQLEAQAETVHETILQERMTAREEGERECQTLREEMQESRVEIEQMKAAVEDKMLQNQQKMLEELSLRHEADLQTSREEMKHEHQLAMEEMLQKQREMFEQLTIKHEEDKKAAQEELKQEHQNHLEEMKQNFMNSLDEKIGAKFQMMQQQTAQKDEQQATMAEIQKLRKEFEDRFRVLQPGGAETSVVVGRVEEAELGATGGREFVTRNSFSRALDESEETTSKLKGKDEHMAPNRLEDSLHIPFVPGMEQSASDRRLKDAPAMLVHPDSQYNNPAADNLGAAVPDVPSSARNGARSKTPQSKTQKSRGKKESSPPSGKTSDTEEKTPARSATADPTDGAGAEEEDLTKAEQFLDWISIRGNLTGSETMAKTISKNVNAALKEEEIPAPRAKCLDTILCLDVSDSIVRDGLLDTVKRTAMDFVDGIEDLMDEMDLEENVAVVAVGGNARVIQHLTNDLTLVREAIDSLDDRGGRSPFMQALLVCLAANKGRGGIVSISGVYKVRPRIIFITDGLATDETQDTGPDMQSNKNQTNFALVQLMSQLASKKQKTTPRPINWVPIGQKADQSFLKSMAELGGGELVAPDNIRQLCRYYKLQQTIGRLYKMVKNKHSNLKEETKLKEVLTAIAYDSITSQEKDYIVEQVKKLHASPMEEDEPEADDFDNVFEDEGKVKSGELLTLGTRVVRGPDWKWKNQDTDGPGTVIQHSKKDNWIYVKWDNGMHNAYRYGQEGASDIVETQHHPRQISPDCEHLDFGVRVVRGPDWRWDNNDDGRGLGTVIRCRESDGRVKVRWDKTGKIYKYNYVASKVREVQIHMPEFPRYGQEEHAAQEGGQLEEDPSNVFPMWKWRDELRQWRLYSEDISAKLEAEYQKRPKASCVVLRGGRHRRVSFKLWQEKTVDGGAATEIQREMVDEERKNDLLAIELSLQDG